MWCTLGFIEVKEIDHAFITHTRVATDGTDIFVTPGYKGTTSTARSDQWMWFHTKDNSLNYYKKKCQEGETAWGVGLTYMENYYNQKRVLLLTGGKFKRSPDFQRFENSNCLEVFDLDTKASFTFSNMNKHFKSSCLFYRKLY